MCSCHCVASLSFWSLFCRSSSTDAVTSRENRMQHTTTRHDRRPSRILRLATFQINFFIPSMIFNYLLRVSDMRRASFIHSMLYIDQTTLSDISAPVSLSVLHRNARVLAIIHSENDPPYVSAIWSRQSPSTVRITWRHRSSQWRLVLDSREGN